LFLSLVSRERKIDKRFLAMGEISLTELEERAAAAGIDLSLIDIDSIKLHPGDDFGVIRSVFKG
jgi:hypothetical protein